MCVYRQIRLLIPGTIIFLVLLGCRPLDQNSTGRIIEGRWEILDSAGLNEPHSFFWFAMDFVEFRPEGTLLGLMSWPPDAGADIRLNKTATYRFLKDGRMEIIGSCRYEDPCSAVFELSLKGSNLRLFNDAAFMELRRMGPATTGDILSVPGPVPTP